MNELLNIDFFNLIPLDINQTSLLIHHHIYPQSTAYNMVHASRLKAGMQPKLLEQAYYHVAKTHECLYSSYRLVDGEGFLDLSIKSQPSYTYKAVKNWSESQIEDWLGQQADISYCPEQGQVCRLVILVNETSVQNECYALFGIHHVCGDYVSFSLMIEKILVLYSKLVKGEQPEKVELSYEYVQWLAQQRVKLQGKAGFKAENYWQQHLNLTAERAYLNRGIAKSSQSSFEGSEERFIISGQLSEQINAFCQAHHTTAFVFFLSVFQHLISRFSGCSDFLIATPTTARHHRKNKNMLGYTINPILIKSESDPQQNFSQIVTNIAHKVKQGLKHKVYPLPDLVEKLKLPADKLFGQMFTLVDKTFFPEVDLYLDKEIFRGERGSAYDLNLVIERDNDSFDLMWRYKSSLFTPEIINVFQNNLIKIIQLGIEKPQLSLAQQSLVPSSEQQHQNLRQAMKTVDLQHDAISLFEQQVSLFPDKIAARFSQATLTYSELNLKANQLAHWLIKQGVVAEQHVALCTERNAWMLISLLAIQKAGAAYVPIDPGHPKKRIEAILAQAEPVLILSNLAVKDILPESMTVTVLEQLSLELSSSNVSNPVFYLNQQNHQQLAYTLFTSGSTGIPKGVQISRGSFVNHLHSMQQRLNFTADDTWLAVTTITFDIAGLELFLPLIVGAEVVVADRNQLVDASQLKYLIETHRVTYMQATPATWHILVDIDWQIWPKITALCGGEALPVKLAADLLGKGVRLLNVYGPTETTVWSSSQWVTNHEIYLGQALMNNQLFILDEYLNLVPPGMIGELYIGGFGLARGYIKRADLTADRFIPDPFSQNEIGSRLYRTGDLVYGTTSGEIEYVGRSDFQVKVRGFRIELGEIEGLLEQQPFVVRAVATSIDDRLVAYCTTTKDPLEQEALITILRESLPDYMVPSLIIPLAEIPLNNNGKIDRKALPAPDFNETQRDYQAPETEFEQQLANIWSALLNVTKVGREDSFFELGGTSLMLNRLKHAIEEQLGLSIALADLFTHTKLSEQAVFIEKNSDDDGDNMSFVEDLLAELELGNI